MAKSVIWHRRRAPELQIVVSFDNHLIHLEVTSILGHKQNLPEDKWFCVRKIVCVCDDPYVSTIFDRLPF